MTNTQEANLKHLLFNTTSTEQWERAGARRRAGVLVPLFSVYSDRSTGIGDFEDLKLLVDWCLKTSNSIIQLLPMNEVGALFCPYDSVSSFALEPMYLALDKLGFADKKTINSLLQNIKKEFPLNKARLDYRVKKEKVQLLWDIFNQPKLPPTLDMQRFIDDNTYWLNDFALFKVLKDYHGGKAWYEWEAKFKNRDSAALRVFSQEHEKEIRFQVWVQYQLYKQFREFKAYAESKQVLIKGDLPILVCLDSADVWAHAEFFKLDLAAGAPPDMYCAKGQRWGMPTYNWERIASDGYRYLKEKLRYAGNFYDLLRVDHVVGIFRIWSIPYQEPLENQGLNGFFDPKDERLWEEHGRRIILVMLKDTPMLLCAEDLGVIPASCPKALKEFGIPGNDIQRWVKDWKIKHDFLSAQEYRLLSVAALSTQDTTNFAAWWENEAGTVDERLFMRKCNQRGIDYDAVKDRLFDFSCSRHGRLRWLNSVISVDILVMILGKDKKDIGDFIDIYLNTYLEKEKLWRLLKMPQPMQERASLPLIQAALKLTLESQAIFCIQLITDWLSLAGLFKDDYYQYRINTPGTVSPSNWSLLMPLSLNELLRHKVCREIRGLVRTGSR